MTDLAEFLLARIADDEAVAQAAQAMERQAEDNDWPRLVHAVDYLGAELADHIARHNPAHVLADCAAKRQIVELHAPVGGYSPPDSWYGDQNRCESCAVEAGRPGIGLGVTMHRRSWPCPTLRLLALPYVDHPDYREEWRP